MRIVLVILAVLGLLLTSLLGLVGTKKYLVLSGDLAAQTAQLSPEQREQLQAQAAGNPQAAEALELPGKLRLAVFGLGATGLAGLILLIALLARKERAVHVAALALVALAGLTMLLSPAYDAGIEVDARTWAVLQGICAGVGALTAFGASRLRRRQALATSPRTA